MSKRSKNVNSFASTQSLRFDKFSSFLTAVDSSELKKSESFSTLSKICRDCWNNQIISLISYLYPCTSHAFITSLHIHFVFFVGDSQTLPTSYISLIDIWTAELQMSIQYISANMHWSWQMARNVTCFSIGQLILTGVSSATKEIAIFLLFLRECCQPLAVWTYQPQSAKKSIT